MPLRVIAFLLALLSFVISCGERSGASSTGDIGLTLDSLELKLARIDYRLAEETWAELTRGESDSLEFFQKLYKSVFSDEAAFADLRGARLRLDRDVDRRRYDALYPLIVRTYIDQSDRVRPVYDTLVEFFSGNWCDYEGHLLSAAGLRQIMAREQRRTDCELAYRALNAPGKPTADLLSRLIRLRNQAARRLGFNDYFALVISSVHGSSEDYLKLIHQVDSVTGAEYRQALDALGRGPEGEVPEPWDWGLSFRNALDQTDRYFPIGSQMLVIDISMAGLGFDLDNLPVYFHLTSDSSLPGGSRLIVVNAPHDVRVVANQAGGIAGIGQLMYTIGQAIHVVSVSQDTELFSRVLDSPWTIGMGMFFQQLCYDADWLRTYAGLPGRLISQLTAAARANELVAIRLLLVDAMFEYEAYRNPNRDLNSLYWDLFEKYTDMPRHDDLTPWAAREELVSKSLDAHSHLLARIIAVQTRSYLKDNYGNIVANPEIRSFLVQNIFRFGSRYPWQELLERGTGEPLSPAYLAVP